MSYPQKRGGVRCAKCGCEQASVSKWNRRYNPGTVHPSHQSMIQVDPTLPANRAQLIIDGKVVAEMGVFYFTPAEPKSEPKPELATVGGGMTHDKVSMVCAALSVKSKMKSPVMALTGKPGIKDEE